MQNEQYIAARLDNVCFIPVKNKAVQATSL